MELSEAYEVVFVEKTSGARLDTAENFWIGNLKAKINISKTFLPKIKSNQIINIKNNQKVYNLYTSFASQINIVT